MMGLVRMVSNTLSKENQERLRTMESQVQEIIMAMSVPQKIELFHIRWDLANKELMLFLRML